MFPGFRRIVENKSQILTTFEKLASGILNIITTVTVLIVVQTDTIDCYNFFTMIIKVHLVYQLIWHRSEMKGKPFLFIYFVR